MIPNITTLKLQARILHKELKATDPKATYTGALHALAHSYRLPNWQTLRAKAQPTGPTLFMEDAHPGIRQTVGNNDISLLWEAIGEGWNGDYDEDDPQDTELLRFSLYRNLPNGDREELPASSYCTRMPVKASQVLLIDALHFMWQVLEKELERAEPNPKRICQQMSWIGPRKEHWPRAT